MKINFETFCRLYSEAKENTDIDHYTLERGWQEWMDGYNTDGIVQLLHYIYECAQGGFRAVLRQYKSIKQLSTLFAVPYGTAQKWNSGECVPPEYTIMMMAYITLINK